MQQNFGLFAFLIILGECSRFGWCQDNEIGLNYESSIFLEGPLLHDVQTLKIYQQPEVFLRLKLLRPQKEVLKEYAELEITRRPIEERYHIIHDFLQKHFINETGLENWTPVDWKSKPNLCRQIKDKKVLELVKELNTGWLKFSRKLKEDVINNPKLYSFLPISFPFFVSNDDQQEMCMWDSYWFIEGLLACDMFESARGLIENCINMIKQGGYCPPCNRIYYRRRVSLPMLPLMMNAYVNKTNDISFLRKYIHFMETDFHQWFSQRVTILKNSFQVFLIAFEETWSQLRPESYKEDLEKWKWPKDELLMSNLFWDVDPVVKIASVKLTALTEYAARILAEWAKRFNHLPQAVVLQNISQELTYTLDHLLKVDGCWRDLHLDDGYKPASGYSLTPVWTGLAASGCVGTPVAPETGPEAVISGQYEAWISRLLSEKKDPDLLQSAVILLMISKQPKTIKIQPNIEALSMEKQFFFIVKLMVLVGLINYFLKNIDRTNRRIHR